MLPSSASHVFCFVLLLQVLLPLVPEDIEAQLAAAGVGVAAVAAEHAHHSHRQGGGAAGGGSSFAAAGPGQEQQGDGGGGCRRRMSDCMHWRVMYAEGVHSGTYWAALHECLL
jgi:hypothetical protein